MQKKQQRSRAAFYRFTHIWLSALIREGYHLPRWLSQRWIKKRRFLLPFKGLDGKDETACSNIVLADAQQARPETLIIYHCNAPSDTLPTPLQLPPQPTGIVQRDPQEQMQILLTKVGQSLDILRQMTAENAALREFVTTPFMLTICMLTYHEMPASHLPQEETLLQRHICKDYIQHMATHSLDLAAYTLPHLQKWLGWLAKQIQMREETVFFLEALQPDWLPQPQRHLYQLSCGLVFGLLGALMLGLILGVPGTLAGGLLGALSGIFRSTIKPVTAFTWSWKRASAGLPGGLLIGLTGGLGGACIYALYTWLSAGPVIGLFYMLVIGLPTALPVGLSSGILGGLLGSIIYGFSKAPAAKRIAHFTSQGIQISATNGLAGALFGGFLGSLLGDFLDIITGKIELLFISALACLLAGALAFGFRATIQYLFLRLWLWQSKGFPWKAGAFLNASVEGLLLQHIDGGYSFIHHYFLDYLANLETFGGVSATNDVPSSGTPETPVVTKIHESDQIKKDT